jgi:putative lipoprotein
MPPRTETGANIVAFELDGKPYVFPKEGMRDYFHFLGSYPNWYCYLNPIPLDEDSLLRMSFRWDASRLGKKYNSNTVAIRMDNLDEDLKKIPFSKKGTLRINSYSSDKIIFFVTKYLPEQHLLCGTFSGTLYEGEGKSMRKVGFVKNGFFDLEYRTQQ